MSDTQQFTPEAVERLAERLGLFTVMSAPEIGGKVVHFHESSPELFTDAQAALRAYAQLLRQVQDAMKALDAIQTTDNEDAHRQADEAMLAISSELKDAWKRVESRSWGFWYA